MGLFVQCRLGRSLQSLESAHVEAESRALISAMFDSLRVETVSVVGSQLAVAEALVRFPSQLAGLTVRDQPTHGISFGFDKHRNIHSRWSLFLEGGALPQLDLCTYHGTGFRSPREWPEAMIKTGGAGALWIDGKGYWGRNEGSIYIFRKRQTLGRALFKGISTDAASDAGRELRQICESIHVSNVKGSSGYCKLSSWSWRQRRFIKAFDRALAAKLGSARLSQILTAMGIDANLWLSAI